MEPIYTLESPLPGINVIQVFQPDINGDHSFYPIKVDGIEYKLKMDEDGHWIAEGLSEDVSRHIGDIVERHEL